MKKLLIIAVSVCAAFAGCTIDERDDGMKNDSRNLITFTTPVMGAVTRGGENPEYGLVDGQKYPENEWFHVFAVWTDADYAGTETWGEKYMDVDVSKKEVDGKKYWAPATDYYWPKNGKLTFAAYSPAKMSPTPTYDGTGLKITDFQTPALGEQYDVMYAPRVFDKTAVDHPLSGATGNPGYGVDIVFKHALSQIKFTVHSANSDIKLKEITITGVHNKGSFDENITNGTEYSAAPTWTPDATSTADYTPFTGDVDVGSSPAEVGTPLLMIPQTLPDNSEITVKWTYRNGGAGGTVEEGRKTFILKEIVPAWEIGKRYTYNITIALDQIYFNSTIGNWDASQIFTVGEGENAVSFEMVYVEGGTFQMGSVDYNDAQPLHQVTLSEYWIGKYEVTQGLWEAVMGTVWPGAGTDKVPNDANGKGADYPAYYVSWNDICGTDGFLAKLNAALATELGGKRFALPTEAQWEFAARGGNKSNGYKYSGSNTVGDVAWYYNNSGSKTHEVGGKAHNELGIHDMTGNVYEWCADLYGAYGVESVIDPTGPETGSNRVLRGGSWGDDKTYCPVTRRLSDVPGYRGKGSGFRLALLP